MKIERTQIHFLSDVLVADASLDLKVLNVVMAETSYQIYKVFSFCDRKRALPLSINTTVLTFQKNFFSEICEND